VVVPNGNVEIRADARMAGHCDGDMCHLPFADSGIPRKGRNTFLIDWSRHWPILRGPSTYLPWPCPSVTNTLPSGAVNWTTSGNFCPGAIPWPLLRLACMDEDGSLVQVNFHPQLDPQGRAATQRKQGGQRQAGYPACAQQMWNADFGKYGQSSSMLELLIGTHEDGGRGTARSIQSALEVREIESQSTLHKTKRLANCEAK